MKSKPSINFSVKYGNKQNKKVFIRLAYSNLMDKSYNILVVNQHQAPVDFLKVVLDRFSKHKYHIQYTNNIEKGKEMLNGDQDLVISGLGNGWGDGYAFLAYVKEHFPEKKTVVMTGYRDGEKREALSRGADGFLELPFELKVGVKTIEDVLD